MDEKLSTLGEFGIIGLFDQIGRPRHGWVEQGIGDDCAVLDIGGDERLLVTCDMLAEGTHFVRGGISAWQLGWKSLAANLSDIAAMGGEPRAAFLALGLSADLDLDFVRAYRDGLADCAREYRVDLLGGDTIATRADIVAGLTVLGRARAGRVISRAGARPGDRVMLGGTVGDSAAGLQLVLSRRGDASDAGRRRLLSAHLEPRPQIGLGRLLAERGLVSAMIDVSDGVLQDLGHICRRSGTGADLDAGRLPISDAARRLADSIGQDAIEWGLAGGEDFVLLFCVPAEKQAAAGQLCRRELGIEIHPLGEITSGPAIRLRRNGAWTAAHKKGYDHFRRGKGDERE